MTKSFEVRESFYSAVCVGGVSLNEAARRVGVASSCAVAWWRQAGLMDMKPRGGHLGGLGVGPLVPSPGSGRLRRALTLHDRRVISKALGWGMSYTMIGVLLERNRSVIWREVDRHRTPDGHYYPSVAHLVATLVRARPKAFKLVVNESLCRRIEEHMDDGWSPQLIARTLAAEGTAKMDRVSHETIYRALYVQTRGALRKDLYKKLSLRRAARKARGVPRQKSLYRDAFTIRQRPPEVADRAVPGHWEGDLILGAGNGSAVGTLVERTTRFVILLHLPGNHDADTVAAAMVREMSKLPGHLRRSITWDRGTELARYADIQLDLQTPIYFCDPHAPWQRGSNENTNRLLRFWLPKGSDLSVFSAEDLDQIAAKLNARPRPTLDMRTPAHDLNELLEHVA